MREGGFPAPGTSTPASSLNIGIPKSGFRFLGDYSEFFSSFALDSALSAITFGL
jgi:hypothetical protein